MTTHSTEESHRGTARILRLLVLPAIVAVGVALPTGANAAAFHPHGDDWPTQNYGNGKWNRNTFVVDSPNSSNDVQHLRNANAGGATLSAIAACKRRVRCRINQNMWVH